MRNAVEDMVAASHELRDAGGDGVSKLVLVFGESMVTLCGIWDESATQLKAKYFKGWCPTTVYFILSLVKHLRPLLLVPQLHVEDNLQSGTLCMSIDALGHVGTLTI